MERVRRQWPETLGRNWPNVFLDHGTCTARIQTREARCVSDRLVR